MISIQYTINLARQVKLPFAYALPCAPVGRNMHVTLEHNYSLLQLYKALISTASLVRRRLFQVPTSMLSFPMATMVGLPFFGECQSILMHDGLIIVGHNQIIKSPPQIFVKLVFIL